MTDPVRHAERLDAELRRHNESLRVATGISSGDRVLDIGCGAGQSTRDAARAAVSGSVLGVDISEQVLARARQLAAEEGLGNVSFEQADAEVHPFHPEHFDVVISRFGTMFFADPVAAFGNIGRALRPGGRLVMMVWQSRDRNAWATEVRSALVAGRAPPEDLPVGSRPFSLGDPADVEGILAAAGFTGVGFLDVHEPVYYGPDVAAAEQFVRALQSTQELLTGLDTAATERALERLRATLAVHVADDGVWFDSRAWIVNASRQRP
jgi:SAM-dependent methyltransferase